MDLSFVLAAAEIRDPLLPLWAMELLAQAFFVVWLFCLGATVGSFLNVVIYRLPRGKNLAFPGSVCPHCGHAIRASDNVPILSWLALRGRCRDCGGPIAARYLFVELAIAILFLVVLAAERNLPVGPFMSDIRRSLAPHDGIPFWCRYGLHTALLTTLVAAAFIRHDGFAVPARLFVPVISVSAVLPLIWPAAHSLPTWNYGSLPGWQAGLIDGAAGVSAGLLMGIVLAVSLKAISGDWPRFAVVALGAALGATLGWQYTLVAFPVAAFVLWVAGLRRTSSLAMPPGQQPSSDSAGTDVGQLDASSLVPSAVEEEIHIAPASEPIDPLP